jgi:GNAT superfamily N-acetyltransferase
VIRPNRAIQAIAENPRSLWKYLGAHAIGGSFVETEGLALYSLPVKHPLFNSVVSSDVPVGGEDAAVEFATNFFAERDRPWNWAVGPGTARADLADRLVERGFTLSHSVPGMAIDLRGFEPKTDPDIREATSPESFEVWLKVITDGYGMPEEACASFRDLHNAVGWTDLPVRYFYLVENGVPVSFSMNYYSGGVAGIFCVATVPEARKRGFGKKVMDACFCAAIEDGYDIAILHSSKAGLRLYEKLGFQEYCKIDYYLPGAGG